MKKISLVLLIMLIPAVVFAEVTKKVVERYPSITVRDVELPGQPKTVIYSDSKGKEAAKELYDENGIVTKTTGKIPDGLVKEYYKSGALLADYNYKNGKLEGVSKGYYESGAYKGEWNYKNGKLEGMIRVYYENGNMNYEMNYKNDKRDGTCKYYWSNGRLQTEWEYKDGKREGVNRVYYENGKINFELDYKNDERNGMVREYYRSGELKAEYEYKDGERAGVSRYYYENGELQVVETFSDGKKTNRKEYDLKGILVNEQNYPIDGKSGKVK